MSMMPDMRPESHIEIPANTQQDFAEALYAMKQKHPEMFTKNHFQTSKWERNFTLTPEGGSFVAALIKKALDEAEGEPEPALLPADPAHYSEWCASRHHQYNGHPLGARRDAQDMNDDYQRQTGRRVPADKEIR